MIADFAPEAALAGLLEAMDRAGLGCTVVLERDGVHSRVYANAALAKIYGRDLESTRALSPLGSLPVVEHERVEKLRALGPTVDEPFETVLLRADGTTVPVAVALGFTTLGGAPATVAFVRDVSQQAQIEAALRDSEDRFRLLAEACPDSITMSLGARYSYANPVALRLLGLSSLEELATFDAWSTVPPNLRDQTSERVARLKRGERVPPFVMYLRRQGKDIAVETSLSLAPVAGGLAILSYSRDVTERQRLQAELMKQDRLASVGTLAAGVGHELNNPLGALTLQSRKLLERADAHGFSPEVRASLQQIDEAATRMRTIISDLLFLARPVDRRRHRNHRLGQRARRLVQRAPTNGPALLHHEDDGHRARALDQPRARPPARRHDASREHRGEGDDRDGAAPVGAASLERLIAFAPSARGRGRVATEPSRGRGRRSGRSPCDTSCSRPR